MPIAARGALVDDGWKLRKGRRNVGCADCGVTWSELLDSPLKCWICGQTATHLSMVASIIFMGGKSRMKYPPLYSSALFGS